MNIYHQPACRIQEAREERKELTELKEQRKREKDIKLKLAEELATIDMERKLAKARSTRNAEERETEKKVAQAIVERNDEDSGKHDPGKKTTEEELLVTDLSLPPDKIYHFFASHKVGSFLECLARCVGLVCDSFASIQKIHSMHGSLSEAIARGAKDWLEAVHGLCGFFDVRADLNIARTLASLTCLSY
jgi:hypothetical protein